MIYTWVFPFVESVASQDVPHFVDMLLFEGDSDGEDRNWAEVAPCMILYSLFSSQLEAPLSFSFLARFDVHYPSCYLSLAVFVA